MSDAKKGIARSDETKRKISDAKKGRPSGPKGMTWKLVNGKRIYSKIKKYDQLALELG